MEDIENGELFLLTSERELCIEDIVCFVRVCECVSV